MRDWLRRQLPPRNPVYAPLARPPDMSPARHFDRLARRCWTDPNADSLLVRTGDSFEGLGGDFLRRRQGWRAVRRAGEIRRAVRGRRRGMRNSTDQNGQCTPTSPFGSGNGGTGDLSVSDPRLRHHVVTRIKVLPVLRLSLTYWCKTHLLHLGQEVLVRHLSVLAQRNLVLFTHRLLSVCVV